MIDLAALHALRSVAALGTLAEAAQELGFTASAVSQQIKRLERQVGVARQRRLEPLDQSADLDPQPGCRVNERTAAMTFGTTSGLPRMIIVAGYLSVDPTDRMSYLDGCAEIVDRARVTEGCLDFALSADLVDPARINVYERWASGEQLHAFRESGPDSDQQSAIVHADVQEYDASVRA